MSNHPEPDVLAAFVEGNLKGAELQEVADHLRECEECRVVAGEAARFEREQKPPARRPVWIAIAASAAVIAIVSSTLILRRRSEPIEMLVAAVPRDSRDVEARITGGFPWAPVRPRTRSAAEFARDPSQMKLIGAAGAVLDATAAHSSPDAVRAAAAARMLTSDPRGAVDLLKPAAELHQEAALWSDLSAAWYEIAIRENSPEHFKDALAAADAALRIDPRLPEALFNRALTIGRLGLRDDARVAWQRYLDAVPSGSWSDEARARLRELADPAAFKSELDRVYPALATDLNYARAFVSSFPQESRTWGEAEILGRWASSHGKNDSDADRHLAVARALSRGLLEHRGEPLLADAVATIDQATNLQRAALARAHAAYREGRITYSRQKPGQAEAQLLDAARQFDETGSPMRYVARYYAANTIFDQNRSAEARQILEEVATKAPARYRALHAQIGWELGLCEMAAAQWAEAIHTLRSSLASFDTLGEHDNAGAVEAILADAYEGLGDIDRSWRHRVKALGRMRTPNKQFQSAFAGMARTAIRARDWTGAASLLELEVSAAMRRGNRQQHVDALLRRALVRLQLADTEAARRDLTSASSVLDTMEDPALKRREQADFMFVRGAIASTEKRADAVTMLSGAIDFHRGDGGRRMLLPQMLLARARAYRQTGQADLELADLHAGLNELESQRDATPAGDERAGLFNVESDLFADAVDAFLRRNDVAMALHWAERGRARLILDSFHKSDEDLPADERSWIRVVQPGTTVLHFANLHDGVRIFVVTADGVSVEKAPFEKNAARSDAAQLRRALAGGDLETARELGSDLHRRLLGAVVVPLRNTRRLIVSGDNDFLLVPWAALRDPGSGRYLIEEHSVVVAPSAAVFLAAHTDPRAVSAKTPENVLVVGSAQGRSGTTPLPDAFQEARSIAALYRRAILLEGAEATTSRFAREAGTAEILHFAGHHRAESDESRLIFEDAAMTALDLAAIPMPRLRVAVLAACDTATGSDRGISTEGVWSSARALLQAGVPSVVATLWPVDDEHSSLFFVRVHEHLRNGLAAHEAVRLTQTEFIRNGRIPASLWAAVQVIGS